LQTKNSRDLSKLISELFLQAGIPSGEAARRDILAYFVELRIWNRVTNLTGLRDPEHMILKHLGDTLLFLKHMPQDINTVLDIGTGAGVPGLLIKIIRRDILVVLAEATRKKCSFLRFVSARLGLQGIFIEEGFLDKANPPRHIPEGGFDIIVSQAAGPVLWLADTAVDFLAPDGMLISLKGPACQGELDESLPRLKAGGFHVSVVRYAIPVSGRQRVMITLEKKVK